MIEIFRKGFRLDVNPNQIITFKKSQNLNGIQDRYAYSNTIPLDKTANNKKLLELFDLPTSKVSSLMNGYTVDIVLNGAIQLRNQTLKIQKETLEKIDTYILYSDNALVVKLKEQFLNNIMAGAVYEKTIAAFLARAGGTVSKTALVETQEKSGLFVIEEMPLLLQLQDVLKKIFEQNNYTVYGDFFVANNDISEYYIAPNQGVYQIYAGGTGFPPVFDAGLNAFEFLSQTLAFFNCFAEVDDTYKTVVINKWTSLDAYKTNYIDYSKYYVNYSDYTFQGKLAKRNELTYSDSGTLFNSFFQNNLSSQDKATYLSSAFGAGSLLTFSDAEIQDDLTIPVRLNGEVGESSAVRIFKISSAAINTKVYSGGIASNLSAKRALSVSMQTIYTQFHKEYAAFILSPLVTNLVFKYDAILAADFSITKVFFVEQLASYWIPLEINFSTKKDIISIKAMLVKKRKVPSPTLNNFNSVFLDFKEKAVFPLSYLLTMYLMPPNEYPWDVLIVKSYDQDFNTLFVNDIEVPANTLPQAFALNTIDTIKILANKATDTLPDTHTKSMYVQAIDTNGGVSNEAYINIKHTGVANLESNFNQPLDYHYNALSFYGSKTIYANFGTYYVGLRPNINDTISSAEAITNTTGPNDTFNLVVTSAPYPTMKVTINPFTVFMKTNRLQRPGFNIVGLLRIYVDFGAGPIQLYSVSTLNDQEATVQVPTLTATATNVPTGRKLRVYGVLYMGNESTLTRTIAEVRVSDFSVDIKTTITL